MPELSEAEADCIQVFPLCILPDKRIALTDFKRKKEQEGDVEEVDEEDEADINEQVQMVRDDVDAIN
jgi:hypothetical protein